METLLIWGIALLAIALLLAIVEIFVPSAGLISIVAIICAIAGLICLYRVDWVWGAAGTLTLLILTPIIVNYGFKILPSTPMGRRMMFGEAGEHAPVLQDTKSELESLLNAEGVAQTDLRPVGVVRIGQTKHDALAEIGYIRAGSKIKVSAVEGTVIKVRAMT